MPKKVAWGYVTRDIGNGKELLIATRCKPNDPLRSGELVIPGGGLEGNESYLDLPKEKYIKKLELKQNILKNNCL